MQDRFSQHLAQPTRNLTQLKKRSLLLSIKTISPGTSLANRADSFDQVIQRAARDEHGIVCAYVCFEPLRSLQPGDIGNPQDLVDDISSENLYAYEDAGMASGAYLASQTIRYRVAKQEQARRNADAVFEGIRTIYDLGAKGKCPGFFPKPYGALLSNHISRDQYLYVMAGLAEYLTIADESRRAIILDMLEQMANYWIDIDYKTSYFGMPSACHLDDHMGSLFLGIIGIAAQATGAPRLQREYERLHHDRHLGQRMPETLMSIFRSGKTYDAAMYFRQTENAIMMKAMAIDQIWDRELSHRDLWRQSLRSFFEDDLLVSLNPESGLNYFMVGYDAESGETFLAEPGVIEELENPLNLSNQTWGGLRQHASSTQTAFATAIIADRLKISDASDTMQLILDKLSLECFRGMTVPDSRHVPPGQEFETELLNTGFVAYWLWTYWLARERSLIDI